MTDHPDLLAAVSALRSGDLGEAARAATAIRRRFPNDARALHVYTLAALSAKDYANALPAAKHCAALDSRAEHLFDVGAAYHGLGDDKHAARWFRACLDKDPDHVPAMMALGACLAHVGKADEVRLLHDRALQVVPTNAAVRHVQGMIRIYRGDFARGWAEHEARWDAPWVDVGWRPPGLESVPRWKGELVRGELVIYAEQGFGDTIMFARYLPICRRLCDDLTVVVQPSMVRLFEQADVADEVIPQEADGVVYRAREGVPHCPMMSLPYACGTTRLEDIPQVANVFLLEHHTNGHWLLPSECPGQWLIWARNAVPRVGLCWAGRGGLAPDHDRTAPAGIFEPLKAIHGVQWVALQRDAAPRGSAKPGRPRGTEYPWITERLPATGDWLDTARFCASLDLVITVDTAMSHLAAALGITTWCLPPTHIEWRCRDGVDVCDWWPTMTYYRRRKTHDWRAAVERIAGDLTTWVTRRANADQTAA